MATYTGQKIKDTYESILKLDDNGNLTSSTKQITDGLGNQTPLSISSTEVKSSVNLEASGFKTPTGTSSEFLKSDGSVDSNSYLRNDSDDTIEGDLTIEGNLSVENSGDILFELNYTNGVFKLGDVDSLNNEIFIESDGSSFKIKADGNTTLTADINNRVGIGQENPSYKLDVSGDGRFTSDITATNFVLSSDKRLKNNIQEIDNKHINVNWKTFEMNSNKGQKRYGVIAQELEEVHPEFVRTDDEGMKSVAYVDLLIAKNAELEARIERLEKLLTK